MKEPDQDLLAMILERPTCEHPGCNEPATGICTTHLWGTMFHRRWCCDVHITGSNWLPIQDTNWWGNYEKFTGKPPELCEGQSNA